MGMLPPVRVGSTLATMATWEGRATSWFGRRAYAGIAAVLVLALGACAVPRFYTDKEIEDPQAIVEAVDWDLAITVTVDIRQNKFTPIIVRMYQGEPYIMVIENRDDVTQVFEAPNFFRTTAIRKIVTEEGERFPRYIAEVVLPPGAIKEVHLVPARDGWYDFKGGGSSLFTAGALFAHIDRGDALGMVGRVIVEP